MKNKCLKIIILILLSYFNLIKMFAGSDSETLKQDVSQINIDNPIYLLGINEEKGIITYINSFISVGKGDIRYSYIVYDFKNNKVLETVKQTWMTRLYDEYGIINWNDEKYSVLAYQKYIEDEIKHFNTEYNLIPCNLKETGYSMGEVKLIEREKIVGWFEKISYKIFFNIGNKGYFFDEKLDKVDYVKNISLFKVYKLKDYYIFIQKLAHDTFEDDDYFDYIIHGIKK